MIGRRHQASASAGRSDPRPGEPVLELAGVDAGYGRVPVLRNASLLVQPHTIVAILGSNGAGKSTLLQVAVGLVRCSKGTVRFEGRDVTSVPAFQRARDGICLIPGGQGVFRTLTVKENLLLGLGGHRVPPPGIAPAVDAFPILGMRMGQVAGTLSGGEQQMLALARAYLTDPRVIFADELSLGLAPIVVDQMFESMEVLARRGTAMVIVEQYANRALAMADTAYVLARGAVAWSGPADDLDHESIMATYMGEGGEK
jgi:branched-chain amino acid transport system ATP-binding protein